ncbi:hypothetical protein D1007_56322 [Hordeum vulgare]|nr:hypothetical protein D1007_56322 [Hordeum vulgare]
MELPPVVEPVMEEVLSPVSYLEHRTESEVRGGDDWALIISSVLPNPTTRGVAGIDRAGRTDWSMSTVLDEWVKHSRAPGTAEASSSASRHAIVLADTTDVMARYHQRMAAVRNFHLVERAVQADMAKCDALFKEVVALCIFSKNSYFKSGQIFHALDVSPSNRLLTWCFDVEGAIPEAEEEDLCRFLVDVRHKRNEVASDRNRHGKDPEAKRAAAGQLRVEAVESPARDGEAGQNTPSSGYVEMPQQETSPDGDAEAI